jgi:uncharacterized protein (DUF849 family)
MTRAAAPLLQAALDGDRAHRAAPRTPAELAAVRAGARALHLRPCDAEGRETLAPAPCAAALRAVRAACPGVPVSLSASAAIEPDPARRLALVGAWTAVPDLVTVNPGEDGILGLCNLLLRRGVGLEAGLPSVADARAFAAAGLSPRRARALVEPLDPDPDDALAHADAIERTPAHGIRTGLEDTPVLPDGRTAAGNGELVAAAAAILAGAR